MGAKIWNAVMLCAVLTLACTGPKGDPGPKGDTGPQGDPAPPPVIASGGGLTGNGTIASPLAIANGAITPAQLAGTARIYSRLMAPMWIQANADIHSARLATITATDISLGAAGAGNDNARLLTVPLLPANTLKAGETYRVRIVISEVMPTGDNDPVFGLTDGTNYIGINKADVANNVHSGVQIGPYGDNLTPTTSASIGAPGLDAETFEFLFQLGPTGGSGTTPVFFTSRVGILSGRYQADLPFDRTAPLSFAAFAGQSWEVYTFTSFEVTIDREG